MDFVDFDQMYYDLMDEAKAAGVKYPKRSDYTVYYAYKCGKAKQFDSFEKAKGFSSNVETNLDKNAYQAALSAYNQAVREAEAKVIQVMKDKFVDVANKEQNEKLFDLAYRKAYEQGHSSGFNELYNYLLDYDDLIQEVIKIIQSV